MNALRDLDLGVIYTGERHFLAPLLPSLAASGDSLSMRLLLVDNDSPDGVDDWLGVFPETRVIYNSRRLGYAANLNRILEIADARYVLLLNTDMLFDPSDQCLARMVRFMDAHPRCGVSICRIEHPDGTYGHPARRFPTLASVLGRRLGGRRFFARHVDAHLYRERDSRGSFACDWVSGCFLFLRREAIDEVGFFDEGFRKYFEDVDLCRRMAEAGWQVMFHGGTRCFHFEQRASRRLLSRDALLHARSYLRWLWKWGFSAPPPPPVEDLPQRDRLKPAA